MNELVADFFDRNPYAQEVFQAGEKLFYGRGAAESSRAGTIQRYTRKEYQAHVDAHDALVAEHAGETNPTIVPIEPAGEKQAKK